MAYTIVVHGKTYRFATLDEANAIASKICRATGVIVGIEQVADRPKFYVGCKTDGVTQQRTVFKSAFVPTFATHGDQWNAVVGPFRTKRGAEFMRDYGSGNPHCRTVDEAERLARAAQTLNWPIGRYA